MLKDAGVQFVCQPARIDEESIRVSLVQENSKARDIADCLADAKACKISSKEHGWVLGADQVLAFEGEIFAKGKNPTDLTSQLKNLSGKNHELYFAAVIYKDGAPVWRFVGVARMSMRILSDDVIDQYVKDQFEIVQNSVGGYHIEGVGAQLFSKIQGDHFTILGLPLLQILDFLRIHGELKK